MDIKVEDGAYIKFKTESGVSGSVKAAFCEARGGLGGTLSNLGYEIYGDKAVLRGYGTMFQLSGYDDEPVKVRLELDSFKNTENVDAGKPENIYSGVIVKHAQSIINSSPAYGKDAVRNLRLIEAAHESARDGGKTIKVK
jgi:predicted dehydrogenase